MTNGALIRTSKKIFQTLSQLVLLFSIGETVQLFKVVDVGSILQQAMGDSSVYVVPPTVTEFHRELAELSKS
jgi:hypothetical protein